MKADIKSTGVLVISAENGLESYALEKWMNDNWDGLNGSLKADSNKQFQIELNCPWFDDFRKIHLANIMKHDND